MQKLRTPTLDGFDGPQTDLQSSLPILKALQGPTHITDLKQSGQSQLVPRESLRMRMR